MLNKEELAVWDGFKLQAFLEERLEISPEPCEKNYIYVSSLCIIYFALMLNGDVLVPEPVSPIVTLDKSISTIGRIG